MIFHRTFLPAAALLMSSLAGAAPLSQFPISSVPETLTTQFSYTAKVPQPAKGTQVLNVWLPIPSNSVWQTVTDLSVKTAVPYQITQEKKHGDRMVYLHDLHPNGPLTATVQFRVCRKNTRVLQPLGLVPNDSTLHASLQSNPEVPVGGKFRAIGLGITREDTSTLAKEHALYNNVISTMTYDYHHVSPEYAQGNANFVCNFKSGNCSDLHSYLIALSRSVGIPAEIDFGFPLTGIPVQNPLPVNGTIPGYHCWVWFKDPSRGWIPLDAADARRWQDAGRPDVKRFLFGNLVLARTAVAMSRGREIMLSPPQKAGPLDYFIYPYAEADGKPTPATWKLSYHLPTDGRS